MIGYRKTIVYNPTCDEKCPEQCTLPWKMYQYQSWYPLGKPELNISNIDLFALPKPQFVSEDWEIDESFLITGGALQLHLYYHFLRFDICFQLLHLHMQSHY